MQTQHSISHFFGNTARSTYNTVRERVYEACVTSFTWPLRLPIRDSPVASYDVLQQKHHHQTLRRYTCTCTIYV